MTAKAWVILIGGFLGAGKTSLLIAASRELTKRGMRSAIIFNDQGDSLVDTEWSALNGLKQSEITGGCFCCKFSQLLESMESLRRFNPDVIFAEPVGSCTDVSATVLHPLKEYHNIFRVAPYTVLVDPGRAEALLSDGADPDLAFLFRKQIEEADLVCFTKSDIYPSTKELDLASARQLSARTGQGVAAWLDELLSGQLASRSMLLDIDYGQYARAEAALAWLNAEATIRPHLPTTPASLLGPLLENIDTDLTASGVNTVHLKAITQAETGFVKASICGNRNSPVVEGMLDASPALDHELLLNIRAVGAAELVQGIVERNLRALNADISRVHVSCFHPAAPRPERRALKPSDGRGEVRHWRW